MHMGNGSVRRARKKKESRVRASTCSSTAGMTASVQRTRCKAALDRGSEIAGRGEVHCPLQEKNSIYLAAAAAAAARLAKQ